jgi:hypothetical protein
MGDRQNIEAIRQFVNQYNHGNVDQANAYLSPEWFNYSVGADEETQDEVIGRMLSDFREAGSNLRISIDDLTPQDGVLWGKLRMWGIHDGPLWGVPATGKPFEMTVDIAIKEIDGRFAFALKNIAPPQAFAILRQIELLPETMDQPPPHPVVHPEHLLKVIFTGQIAPKPCSHLDMIAVTAPSTDVCQQCVESGDIWPALRMCLVCGFVGCCDTSKNTHMKAHYVETGHCIFRSVRMEEGWGWCYECNAYFHKRELVG